MVLRNLFFRFCCVGFAVASLTACGANRSEKQNAPEVKQEDPSKAEKQNDPIVKQKESTEKVVLKFAHHYPIDNPHTISAELFKKKVEEDSNGEIEIQLYPNNELGDSKQLWEGLKLGSVDIALTDPGAPAFSNIPVWDVVMGPFMYRDYQHAYDVSHSDMMKKMYTELEEQEGIKVIDPSWFYGVRVLTTADTPVETPDDMEGLKIRTPDIPGFIKGIEVLGATPTPIAFADLYMSLKQHLVEGQENPMGIIYANKYYEAQNYLILTNHIISRNTVFMRKESFDKLSPENQKIILTAIDEAGRNNDELTKKQESEMLEKLKEKGMTVIDPDHEAFFEKATKGLKEWFNDEQREFYDAVQKM